jgi:hypothetical protein
VSCLAFINFIFIDPCIVDDSVEIPTRCRFVIEFIIPKFIEGSTCMERHTANYQELYSFPTQPWQQPGTTWVYKPEATNTVWSSWWWAVCRSKRVEPPINFGIINSIRKLYLVGISIESFTMHGSMNIKHTLIMLCKYCEFQVHGSVH